MIGQTVRTNVKIDGKELALVPTTEAHLAKCRDWLSDPETCRYMKVRFAPTEEGEKAWFRKTADDDTCVIWSIMLGEEHVGQTGFHRINQFKQTAVTGIMIGKEYWHKGIASAVMPARTKYGFEKLNLVALFTEICVHNPYSRKAAETAGYVGYGIQPCGMYVDGEHLDVWLGCLKRTDWEKKNK